MDKFRHVANNIPCKINFMEENNMKATGIVRRIDDLGRIVIPKEIRRTMRIHEGDPSLITLSEKELFCNAMFLLSQRFYVYKNFTTNDL